MRLSTRQREKSGIASVRKSSASATKTSLDVLLTICFCMVRRSKVWNTYVSGGPVLSVKRFLGGKTNRKQG